VAYPALEAEGAEPLEQRDRLCLCVWHACFLFGVGLIWSDFIEVLWHPFLKFICGIHF
jgi:hypothetical protein